MLLLKRELLLERCERGKKKYRVSYHLWKGKEATTQVTESQLKTTAACRLSLRAS